MTLRAIALLSASITALVAMCGSAPAESVSADAVPPEIAEPAVSYATALAEGELARSWELLSAESQTRMTGLDWEKAFRQRPQTRKPSATGLLRAIAAAEEPPTAGDVLLRRDEALIGVSGSVQITQHIVLVREDGAWRVDLEATDRINSRVAAQTFLDALREESGAAGPAQRARRPQSNLPMLQVVFAPEAKDYQALGAEIEGDRADVILGAELPVSVVLRTKRVGPGWMVDLTRPALDIDPTEPDPLAKAAAKADQSLCEERLRSLGRAFQMYAAASDDLFPDPDRWLDQIRPYLDKSTEPHCPADPTAAGVSYAMNRNLAGWRRRDVGNQNSTPLLIESDLHTANPADTGESWSDPARHDNGNLVLFVDGSVRLLTAKPLFEVTKAPPGGSRSGTRRMPSRLPRTGPPGAAP
jgi:prepilin-type processing-associated H-X9-DG protein